MKIFNFGVDFKNVSKLQACYTIYGNLHGWKRFTSQVVEEHY